MQMSTGQSTTKKYGKVKAIVVHFTCGLGKTSCVVCAIPERLNSRSIIHNALHKSNLQASLYLTLTGYFHTVRLFKPLFSILLKMSIKS